MARSISQEVNDRLVPVWLALGVVFAVFVGTGAGILRWLSGQDLAAAVLTGGGSFGTTVALIAVVITLLKR